MHEEARAALRRFVEGDYARVVGAVTVICGDAHRAADAVQDALAGGGGAALLVGLERG